MNFFNDNSLQNCPETCPMGDKVNLGTDTILDSKNND